MKPVSTLLKKTPPPKYELFNHDNDKDFACIRILEGEYVGVEYHYEKVSLRTPEGVGEEEDDDGPRELSFTYVIMNSGEELVTSSSSSGVTKNESLEGVLCSILFHIVENKDAVQFK